MKNKKLEQKLVDLIFLGSLLIGLYLVSKNQIKDVDFLMNGKYCKAKVESISKDNNYNPYSITYTFYDSFAEELKTLTDNVDGEIGRSIEKDSCKELEIAYTRSHIYYIEKGKPTVFMVVFRTLILMIILVFTLYSLKCLFKHKPILPLKDENNN